MWIRQPLYAGDLWDVDKEDWEYEPVLVKDTETNNITVKFQQVPPEHLCKEIFSQAAEMFGPDKTEKVRKQKPKKRKKNQTHKQQQKIAQTKNHPNLVLIQTLPVLTSTLKWS